ncbi:MAG: type III secretion system stator protein SctL [Deltaproteobacteria bacterium]|nr:type III secretion system stator protein SctL [Deltaproteobacteria bacterium]
MVGKIIKSGESGAPSVEPLSQPRMAVAPRRAVMGAEEVEARGEAHGIVAQAEQRAAAIIAKAEQERAQVLAKAREEGRQLGYGEMTEILARAKIQAGELLKATEPEVVKLAMKAAERIIGAELATDEDTILRIVAKAIEQLRQSKELIIRANPDDVEILRREKRKLLEHIGRLKDIGFREDPAVQRGGCVIETEAGTVDAQLSTQLELLQRALLGES